jgi:UDP-2,3-diacylglucosamine pyrophosphatase LpxH
MAPAQVRGLPQKAALPCSLQPSPTVAAGAYAMMRVRALFLSDIHLGSRACQAERLLAFLKECDARMIFLLGDIVDFWSLKRSVYWPASHNTVVQKLLKRARSRVKILYIPGNHDEALRNYLDSSFGNICVKKNYVHVAADGMRYALLHGDEFDQVTTCARWLSMLGDWSYNLLVDLNRGLSWWRRKLRRSGHWSLADYAKRNLRGAADFIAGYEHALARHGEALRVNGVICGHIHTPGIKRIDRVLYLNCGDWVDSCTAIVEHFDGRMELVRDGVKQTSQDQQAEELEDSVAA